MQVVALQLQHYIACHNPGAATVNAADLLGMSDVLGTIEKGKITDIIAVSGHPLQNIDVMSQVKFVMKEGKIYRSEQ